MPMAALSQDVSLKDGRRVRVRTLAMQDVPARFEMLRQIASEGKYTLSTPAELDKGRAKMPRRVEKLLTRSDALCLVAVALANTGETGEEVLADLMICAHDWERMRHTALLGIDIAASHRGVGLGDAMTGMAMAWARAHPQLRRTELWVYAANRPAIALYRKHGFEIEGTRRCAMQLRPGEYMDDHLMACVWAG